MPLAISASPIGSINPAILNNQNPTIWSQATVPTLKQEIKNLYNFNVALYNNRTIFGAPHLDCTAPEPPSYYGIEDICVESDIVSFYHLKFWRSCS